MKEYPDLKSVAEDVLMLQDACNGQAVIRSFPAIIDGINRHDPQAGTEALNKHPLVLLVLDKLTGLCGGYTDWGRGEGKDDAFSSAYDAAREMADWDTP